LPGTLMAERPRALNASSSMSFVSVIAEISNQRIKAYLMRILK
jgi:hypothetical protein